MLKIARDKLEERFYEDLVDFIYENRFSDAMKHIFQYLATLEPSSANLVLHNTNLLLDHSTDEMLLVQGTDMRDLSYSKHRYFARELQEHFL